MEEAFHKRKLAMTKAQVLSLPDFFKQNHY